MINQEGNHTKLKFEVTTNFEDTGNVSIYYGHCFYY